jgi:hypothetical protein
MKLLSLSIIAMCLLAAVTGCDDDPASVPGNSIRGSVKYDDSSNPAEGSLVYLGQRSPYFPDHLVFTDSTRTNNRGSFLFEDLLSGSYQLYAAREDGEKVSGASLVSPLSSELIVEKNRGATASLRLWPVVCDGTIMGIVLLPGDGGPADNVPVTLHRLEGIRYIEVDSARTGTDGLCEFVEVCTGNYRVFASFLLDAEGPYPQQYWAESGDFFCEGSGTVQLEPLQLTDLYVDKPVIYIYPEQAGRFQVELALSNGTEIVTSKPEYGSGWDVFVEPSGRIDDRYDYLFYEAAISMIPPMAAGWCFEESELSPRLEELLHRLGLNAAEADAFLEYWLGRLPAHPFYKIRPVTGRELDAWVALGVTPAPESVLRLWFFFQGCADYEPLEPCPVTEFVRTGTTVVEWGGAVVP